MSDLQDVFKGFDFDFCKVWFDGKEFHAADTLSVETLSCTLSKDPVKCRNPSVRIPKYEARGFSIRR